MEKLTIPVAENVLIDKLNEIIDWLNGRINSNRIKDIQVAGKEITIIYIDGRTETVSTKDTQYVVATAHQNGLMRCCDVQYLAESTKLLTKIESIITKNAEIQVLKDKLAHAGSGGGGSCDGGDGGGDGGGDCSCDGDCGDCGDCAGCDGCDCDSCDGGCDAAGGGDCD